MASISKVTPKILGRGIVLAAAPLLAPIGLPLWSVAQLAPDYGRQSVYLRTTTGISVSEIGISRPEPTLFPHEKWPKEFRGALVVQGPSGRLWVKAPGTPTSHSGLVRSPDGRLAQGWVPLRPDGTLRLGVKTNVVPHVDICVGHRCYTSAADTGNTFTRDQHPNSRLEALPLTLKEIDRVERSWQSRLFAHKKGPHLPAGLAQFVNYLGNGMCVGFSYTTYGDAFRQIAANRHANLSSKAQPVGIIS